VGHFVRAFTLSNKIDQDHISADIAEGVLTLTLRKRSQHPNGALKSDN
jgi:HSP20 family molecular chaperone IbpA